MMKRVEPRGSGRPLRSFGCATGNPTTFGRRGLSALALAGLLIAASPVSASVFTAQVFNWDFVLGQCGSLLATQNPSVVSPLAHPWPAGGVSVIQVAAFPGALSSSYFYELTNQSPSPTGQFANCTSTMMVVDDITIVGPGPTVDVGVSMDLEGGGVGSGGISFEARLELIGTAPGGGLTSTGPVSRSLLGRLTTPNITVRVDQPLTLIARFDAQAGLLPGPVVTTLESSNSFNYRRLPPVQEPVLILPPDHTAYSIDGRIVDNVYVPEPAFPLGVAGAVLSLVSRLRRRRRG